MTNSSMDVNNKSVDTIKNSVDIDPQETQEWLDSLEAVLEREGPERAHFILEHLIDEARRSGSYIPYDPNTAYVNTIPVHKEARSPGDAAMEWKIRSFIRWNALAMVVRANRLSGELGGHIASFGSSATLYEVGFNHFWRAPTDNYNGEAHGGDLLFIQGHVSPGIYSRAYVEHRLHKEDLRRFRQEALEPGLSSYPHPHLMPEFWQFPTVSMGLGPLMAIYQARFMKYMHNRSLIEAKDRKVWCFCGDGEMDEPESLGAISLAGRENLDNLVFVVNCNLQRLDGPVRGNGKIIQELEGEFRGAGWNVIKVIWGSYWDPLFAKDKDGILRKRMEEAVDGEYQAFKSRGGAYTREKFFGKYPELKEMVASMSDDDIWRLNRGGHDPHKVYAAYAEAMKANGKPTVILAKTVKGYGMGEAGEGQNITHQQKKIGLEALRAFRDRFDIPISDEEISEAPFYRPEKDSPEFKYLDERRKSLGGSLPVRRTAADEKLTIPGLEAFDAMLKDTGEREISTTMAFVRILSTLLRDKNIGKRIVPIVPDESRTFGMEGLFRQLGIYSPRGQLYEPEDSDQLSYYKEQKDGQVLQEGINEAGAFSSFIAAGTSYSNHNVTMIPFYIYYSMFGFQRIGDLAWAAADMRTRGFLIGGTAGRTTLAGEGLQHQDGHSHLMASTIPNCIAYDPTFAYEMAVIVQSGLERMYVNDENVYYYIAAMNENYHHPAMPEGAEEGIIKGIYKFKSVDASDNTLKVNLLGSGTILREVIAAADLLAELYNVPSDIWSVTSFNELAREARDCSRHNMLHPEDKPRISYIGQHLDDANIANIVATDYVRNYAEQVREFVKGPYTVLGTDGFGRSDTREMLREFFEVNRFYVVVATLKTLADQGKVEYSLVTDAIKRFGINQDKPNPFTQ